MRTLPAGKATAIRATSLDTALHHRVPFVNSGSSTAILMDGAATPSGDIVVAGERGSSSPEGFVTELDINGTVLSSFSTGDFIPMRVCVAAGGQIWALGQTAADKPGDNYPLLRSYTSDGTSVKTYLSRGGFYGPINLFPAGSVFGRSGATPAFLACGDSGSVGAYVGYPSSSSWIQITPTTGASSQVQVKSVANAKLTGLALSQSDQVYATFQLLGNGSRQTLLYVLAPTSKGFVEWNPVAADTQAGQASVGLLLGTNATSLVFSDSGGGQGLGTGTLSFSVVH